MKRQLNELTEEFNNLKLLFQKQQTLSNGLNDIKNISSVEVEEIEIDEVDSVVQEEGSVTVFSDEGFKIRSKP
ncbi:MAG: hypothetical protein U7123_00860 [Potamolinea sp.]